MLELLYRYIARSLFRDRRSDGSKTASPVGTENRTRDDRRLDCGALPRPLRRTEVRARSHELARTRSARSPIPKKQDREVGPAGARAHPYTPNPTSHALSSANGARTSCCSHPLPCPLSNSSNSSRRPSLRLQVPVARCSGPPHLRRCSLRRLSAARRTVTCTHGHGRVAGRHLVEEL